MRASGGSLEQASPGLQSLPGNRSPADASPSLTQGGGLRKAALLAQPPAVRTHLTSIVHGSVSVRQQPSHLELAGECHSHHLRSPPCHQGTPLKQEDMLEPAECSDREWVAAYCRATVWPRELGLPPQKQGQLGKLGFKANAEVWPIPKAALVPFLSLNFILSN